MPLGLAVLAAGLAGNRVRILDLNLYPDPFEVLESELARFKPDVTGFSLRNCDTTSSQDPFSYLPAFQRQIKLTRKLFPATGIIVGGAGFSIFPGEILAGCPEISFGITGHGEGNIADIIRSNGTGVIPGRSALALNPLFNLLDLPGYLPFQKNLSAGVEVNRGCREKCRYCSYPAISGSVLQERPLRDVYQDIVTLSDTGVSHFFFVAPVLNSSRKRGLDVADMARVIPAEFTWESYQTPEGFDMEYAGRLAGSGCTAVSFSPDGGTDEQLQLMGKRYRSSHVEKAVAAAHANGIQVSLNLFPWHRETGVKGMFMGFRNGSRWGRTAGSHLRRLRFSLIRRMPGTPYREAQPSFSDGIPPGQFVRPSPAAMPAFLILKRLFERNMIQ